MPNDKTSNATGYLANRSVEQQFQSERGAAVQDLRRAAYVNFLQELDVAEAAVAQADEPRLRASEAAVLLLASPEVRGTVRAASEAAFGKGDYFAARNAFIDAAQRELLAGE